MKRIMSFLAGAFCGAVVGSVSALLLAPMPGAELQHQAQDRFQHLVEDTRHAAEAKRTQLEAQLAALKAPPAARVETPAQQPVPASAD